jgi:hypothetical protein
VVFETIEMSRPELAIGGKPVVELRERLRSDAVQATLRIGAGLHEPRILEDAEVLRDSRLTQAEVVDEVADGPLAVAEQIEDCEPLWLGQNLKCGELAHGELVLPVGYIRVKE